LAHVLIRKPLRIFREHAADHIIAPTDASGVTRREYLWLDDLPVAVVDGVNMAAPATYFMHADHLGRRRG
jgi:hypothetical protein